MRRFTIPFIALAFIISAAGAAPAAHAQSCTEGSCPKNFYCDIAVGYRGWCIPSSGSSVTDTSPTGSSVQNVPGSNVTLINPLRGGDNLQSFLLNILSFVINIGSIVVVLMLVYIGYLFVIAQGEPGKISEARNALLWTVIGALVLLGSKAIALGVDATVKALSGGS